MIASRGRSARATGRDGRSVSTASVGAACVASAGGACVTSAGAGSGVACSGASCTLSGFDPAGFFDVRPYNCLGTALLLLGQFKDLLDEGRRNVERLHRDTNGTGEQFVPHRTIGLGHALGL